MVYWVLLPCQSHTLNWNGGQCLTGPEAVKTFNMYGPSRSCGQQGKGGSTAINVYSFNKDMDGGWGAWTGWGQCSRSCGGGVQYRYRRCDSPPPIGTGHPCQGRDAQVQDCNTDRCPTLSRCGVKYHVGTPGKSGYINLVNYDNYMTCEYVIESDSTTTGAGFSIQFAVNDGTRKSCMEPRAPFHGSFTGGNFVGDTITFSCHHGYHMSGQSVIECVDQPGMAAWTHDFPYCLPGRRRRSNQRSLPVGCTFEGNLCGFRHESQARWRWGLRKDDNSTHLEGLKADDSRAREGYYLFVESSRHWLPYDTARVTSEHYVSETSAPHCLKFWYRIHGNELAALRVLTLTKVDQEGKVTWSSEAVVVVGVQFIKQQSRLEGGDLGLKHASKLTATYDNVVSQIVIPTPAINSVLSAQLTSLPERIDLVLDQNDYNGDSVIDINDIDIDLLRYQRDSDLCCTSRAEWVDQFVTVYGLTPEYADSRYPGDPTTDCLSVAAIQQNLGTSGLDYAAFINMQINTLAAQQTPCAQAVNNFQTACNGVNTAGVAIPTNVNDSNLPTLAQNCALLNNFLSTRI
nr:hypothetical protein BaRGS_007956 [Batillaria attramentaria]